MLQELKKGNLMNAYGPLMHMLVLLLQKHLSDRKTRCIQEQLSKMCLQDSFPF